MRSFYLILCSSLFLFGCHKQAVLEQPELSSTLHPVDTSQAPGIVEQYRFGMTSVGGWVNQKLGQRYHPVQAQHNQAAVVYLYRPDTVVGIVRKLWLPVFLSINIEFRVC